MPAMVPYNPAITESAQATGPHSVPHGATRSRVPGYSAALITHLTEMHNLFSDSVQQARNQQEAQHPILGGNDGSP